MEQNNPLVSICVPIYGVEKYIECCAVSLFEQTYQNIEYVFINDCTKDRSIEKLYNIIGRFPSKKDRIKIINHENNKGLSGARITALHASSGEFISWVDSDDYIENDMIEKLVDKAKDTGADIISCNSLIHYPNKVCKLISPQYNSSSEMVISMLNRQSRTSVWARLIRRTLYLKHDIHPTVGINNGEDLQVMPILAYYGKPAYIDDYLYHYNCANANSYTAKFTRSKADDVWSSLKILETFFQDKEIEYYNVLKYEEANTIIKDCVRSCREGYADYYHEARNRMKDVDKFVRQSLPLSYKLIYGINSYKIIRCIVQIADLCSMKPIKMKL